MKVIGCQFDIAWENQPANCDKVRRRLAEGPVSRGAMVVLPEMFSTGFSMNVEAIAEPKGGQTEQFLAAVAREFGVFVLGGVVTPGTAGKGRNEAVIFSPEGREIARYAKMHCFNPSNEGDHYEAGDRPVLVEAGGWQVAPFVCYDLRFPEIFRSAAAAGAQLLAVIANWPAVRIEHWIALLRARAIENQAYVIGVNRVGQTPKLAYCGRSLVVAPRGEIIADGGEQEGLVSAEIDLQTLVQYRQEFAVLPDLRADWVTGI